MTTKKVILFIIYTIAIIGIAVGVVLVRQRQVLEKNAAPLTTLSFNPTSLSIIRGQNFTVSSRMNSGTNVVTGIDIELTYNPAVIQVSSVTPTAALSNFTQVVGLKNEIDNTVGRLRYVAFTTDKTLGISGIKDLITITGNIKSTATAGSYQLNYGSLTTVAAVGEGQNAVLNKTAGTIVVTLPTPVPTASPSPTVAPTIRPTATATATATVTASPKPIKIGDINTDGFVNMLDIGTLVDNYEVLPITVMNADLNDDGAVNMIDIGIVIDNYEN